MTNIRARDLLTLSANNSAPARLPPIPEVASGDPTVREFAKAVKERLELREGARGNPFERALTARDLVDIGLVNTNATLDKQEAILIRQPSGLLAGMSVDEFSNKIRNTPAFRKLVQSLDDVNRFKDLPQQLQATLLKSIADEAAARGADIRRTENKQQSLNDSFATLVQEVTASIAGAQAGIRSTQFAVTEINKAVAGQIIQVQTRLDNFGVNGGPGTATIEEVMQATADRTAGLAAEYHIKVQAGNKVAGISLAASEDPQGNSDSAFLVLADRFAFVLPSDPTPNGEPPAHRIPFGIDASGLYINSQVRIRTDGGGSISSQDVATNSQVPAINFIGNFSSPPATTGLKKNSVYKNTTDKKSYILSANGGSWIEYLTSGERGSRTVYAPGSVWSDQLANDFITGATGSSTRVIGDTVTISSAAAGFSQTKYWNGFAWVDPGVVIDGNLLVNGSIAADKIAANSIRTVHLQASAITAEKMSIRSVTAENGAIADLAVTTLKIGNEAVIVPRVGRANNAHAGVYVSLDFPAKIVAFSAGHYYGGSPAGGVPTSTLDIQLNAYNGITGALVGSDGYIVINVAPGYNYPLGTIGIFDLPAGFWFIRTILGPLTTGGHQPIRESIVVMAAKR